VEVVASLSQGRTAAAQCGLFTHKSVPVIFEPPCMYNFWMLFVAAQVKSLSLEAELSLCDVWRAERSKAAYMEGGWGTIHRTSQELISGSPCCPCSVQCKLLRPGSRNLSSLFGCQVQCVVRTPEVWVLKWPCQLN